MMHHKISALAEYFGVRLSERSCREGHIYDGRTIALMGSRVPLSDHDLLHEIAHFAVATPGQRLLPEYGLGNATIAGQTWIKAIVSRNEREIQERMCMLLSARWGIAYDISAVFSAAPHTIVVWEKYIGAYFLFEDPMLMWEALFRLDGIGLLLLLPI
jgi:hypothetical protein